MTKLVAVALCFGATAANVGAIAALDSDFEWLNWLSAGWCLAHAVLIAGYRR